MAARQEVTLVIRARDQSRAVFRRIGRGIRRLRVGIRGLLVGGVFAKLTKDALGWASAIQGASDRLDVSVETIQGLKILAERLAIPFESLQGVIQRINRTAGQAITGDLAMLEAFKDLGITFKELKTLSVEDLFFRVADAASDTSRSWRETSALIARIGESEAVRLRKLLIQGGDALRAGVQELADADTILGEEALAAAAEKNSQAAEALRVAQNDFTEAILALTPVLVAVTPVLKKAVEGLILLKDTDLELPENVTGRLTRSLIEEDGEPFPFGRQVGEELFRGFGEKRNISGTFEDPAVRQALLETAAATKETVQKLDRAGALR